MQNKLSIYVLKQKMVWSYQKEVSVREILVACSRTKISLEVEKSMWIKLTKNCSTISGSFCGSTASLDFDIGNILTCVALQKHSYTQAPARNANFQKHFLYARKRSSLLVTFFHVELQNLC